MKRTYCKTSFRMIIFNSSYIHSVRPELDFILSPSHMFCFSTHRGLIWKGGGRACEEVSAELGNLLQSEREVILLLYYSLWCRRSEGLFSLPFVESLVEKPDPSKFWGSGQISLTNTQLNVFKKDSTAGETAWCHFALCTLYWEYVPLNPARLTSEDMQGFELHIFQGEGGAYISASITAVVESFKSVIGLI